MNSTPSRQPTRFSAAQLLAEKFPEPTWVVPGLVPQGLTLLAGNPTVGKTSLALGLALAVAGGAPALGAAAVMPGSVLYVAFEDRPPHLQARLRAMLHGDPPPASLEFWTTCPALDSGGIRALITWASGRPNPRLIVLDTLSGVVPAAFARLPAEDRDSPVLNALALFGQSLNVSLLVLHHARIGRGDDLLRILSGDSYLSRTADGVLLLDRPRHRSESVLHVGGRSLPASRHTLSWDGVRRTWSLAPAAPAAPLSPARQAIIAALRSSPGPLSPREVTALTALHPVTVRGHLRKMARAGQILALGAGRYAPIDE